MRVNSSILFALLTLLFIAGCGMEAGSTAMRQPTKSEPANPRSESPGWKSLDRTILEEELDANDEGETKQQATKRKIIYTASLTVVVKQFDGVEKMVTDLVSKHGGFVSSANLGRLQGQRRRGYWTVRVPVNEFDSFLNAVGDIGVPETRTQDASDVTEEFVDITARVANKRKLEARILELLERPDDKIQHVIEVERELARVREEIERMEGRLRYLNDQTSMTTVSIEVREEQNYIPVQAPTFSNRIKSAWTNSLDNCRRFFENATVFVVGNVIGFGIFLVVAVIALAIFRRLYRMMRKLLAQESQRPV